MVIELSNEECQMLKQLLDAAIRDLGPEIRHTMTHDYKDDLKAQKRTVQQLYHRLCTTSST